jgi:hypothetical protein
VSQESENLAHAIGGTLFAMQIICEHLIARNLMDRAAVVAELKTGAMMFSETMPFAERHVLMLADWLANPPQGSPTLTVIDGGKPEQA